MNEGPALRGPHSFGGDGGIRTRGCLHNTRFPSVLLRPLGHVTKEQPEQSIRSIRATVPAAEAPKVEASGRPVGENA